MSAPARGRGGAPVREGDRPAAGRALSWPGVLLACLALGMFQATLLFAYGYLSLRQGGWPPPGVPAPGWGGPALATLALLASLVPALALARAARRGSGLGVQVAAAALVGLGVLFLALQAGTYADLPVGPAEHAYGSAFVTNALAQHAFAAGGLLAAALLLPQVWGVTPPERVRSSARGLALYWAFVVADWLLVAAVLYASPALLGGAP